MLDRKNLTILAKQVAKANKTAPAAYRFGDTEYSFEMLNETLRDEFKLLASSYNDYRRNKNDIFEIMQEVTDEILPNKVLSSYGDFAEVKQYGQGNKPSFVKRTGAQRAKQFITKVGLAGIYEVFKLDKEFFEIDITAYGGAAQIGLEEFLDGLIDFPTLIDVIIEGLSDAVYTEIGNALGAIETYLPAANQVSGSWSASSFDGLITVARAYGVPVIYCHREFANANLLTASGWTSDSIRDEMYNNGLLGKYKGVKVIVLPNSFTDATNTTQVMDVGRCYVIPTGSNNDKPVKIAMEGETIIDEYVNKDRSREIQAYKKFGVGIVTMNDICVYEDTGL